MLYEVDSDLLDRAIVEALRETSVDIPGGAPELAWRLLVGLHVIETRLEEMMQLIGHGLPGYVIT